MLTEDNDKLIFSFFFLPAHFLILRKIKVESKGSAAVTFL